MNYKSTIEFMNELDAKDELSKYRNEFHIPLQKNGDEQIYMCAIPWDYNLKDKRLYKSRIERLGKIRCRGSL